MKKTRIWAALALLLLMMSGSNYAYTKKQEQWFKLMDEVYVDQGIGIDQDDVMGAQCVDLASNYAAYIYPINRHKYDYKQTLNFGDGKDLYDNAYPEYFYKIPHTKGVIPKRGDIVVWGGPTTIWGHVGVVADADAGGMTVIHQNAGSRYGVIKTREGYGYHSFSGVVVGYLRPKDDMIKKLNPGAEGNPYYNLDTKLLSRGSDLLRPEEMKKLERAKYTRGYNAVVELGLMNESATLPPTSPFTRLQGIVLTMRVTGLEAEVKAMDRGRVKAVLSSLYDENSIADWGRNYAASALDRGVVKGITTMGSQPQFKPDQALTGRAYTTILMRALGYRDVSYEGIREQFVSLVGLEDEAVAYVGDLPLDRNGAGAILYSVITKLEHRSYSVPLSEFLIGEDIVDSALYQRLLAEEN